MVIQWYICDLLTHTFLQEWTGGTKYMFYITIIQNNLCLLCYSGVKWNREYRCGGIELINTIMYIGGEMHTATRTYIYTYIHIDVPVHMEIPLPIPG